MRFFSAKKMIYPVIALVVCLMAASGAWAAWTARAPMNVARDGSASGTFSGKFYVYGGYDGTNLVNSLEIYDPAANTWSTVNQATGVRDITGTETNGKLYMFGGHFNGLLIDHFEKSYDPATGILSDEIPRLPLTAQANCVTYTTTVWGQEIFVFGGADNNGNLVQSVLAYNPALKTWREATVIPSDYLTGGPAMGLAGSTVFLMGGQNSSGPVGNVVAYNIRTETWYTFNMGTIKIPRRFPTGHIVPNVRDRFFLIGGNQGMAAFPSQAVAIYDPAVRLSWEISESLPEGVSGNTTFLAGSDSEGYTIYVAGGINLEQLRTNKVWSLKVDNGRGILPWQQAPDGTDLNGNGTDDNLEPDRIKVVKTFTGNALFGVDLNEYKDQGFKIESIQALPSSAISSAPRTFPVGLVTYKIKTPTIGAQVVVTLRLSYDAPADNIWYKWTYFTGWYDYSLNVTKVNSRTYRILLTDGGEGDADGVADGVITDPIGPSIPTPVVEDELTVILPDSGGCFINAIFG